MKSKKTIGALIILGVLIVAGAIYYSFKKSEPVVEVTPKPSDGVVVNKPNPKPIEPTKPVVQKDRVPSRYVCVGEFCDGSGDPESVSSRTVVQIPLIKDGGNVGCGVGVFYAPHTVAKTTGVLDATYRLLFDLKPNPEISADAFRNTLGGYTKLHYDSVSITNGTAKVMLSGTMYGPGHCAEPEMRAQVNQAAFYFDTVKKVEVYLNGKLFDWCTTSDADPSEDRCDTTPRYWIDTK